MAKASQPIESFYHKVYETMEALHQEAEDLKESLDQETPVDQEKIERTEFALQLSKDILENFVDSGKSMTINYDHRSVTIEVSK
ncbi:hypothetical protein [Halobacillus sp. BBL2006]|uniref:hypothetical protein n=1 Tax=Halobacillus sp. BBL2006 TaxID=1543706 RepID=UPI0005438BB4|nr:hypothetical protein [Halobacillus sp. BBL2006]KHE70343.1 hypothetical protein LD39_11720 [Halobacillus sp. BBL2006]